ncbi:MAG: penicillin-binding transpeptidase domain-containing protein [Thermodesulfobacteriota bacterium]|nr:penicillin-binding transpeptidase domain-containing protein [Thermodesulfobacteriota bacterium]
MHNNLKKNSWRGFQTDLQLHSGRKKTFSKIKKTLTLVFVVSLILYGIDLADINIFPNNNNNTKNADAYHKQDTGLNGQVALAEKDKKKFTKKDLQTLLLTQKLVNCEKKNITLKFKDTMVEIETSLNMQLQHFILKKLERLKTLTRGKPHSIGIIAMAPGTGEILAMTGFNLSDPEMNPCAAGDYPAASIFKIITASAAVETCGYTLQTPLYFNGGKYTLYKRQLKEKRNRYTRKVSFAHAFAESINPVFGKLGSIYLGGETLRKYANAFGFNRSIDSDISFEPGSIKITDKSYQWAEVGCGFNKTTTISPLFAAMVTSTIINSGSQPVPWIVEKVTNSKGEAVYKQKNISGNRAIKQETAHTIMKMMNKTIATGTASKAFRGFKKDSILSKLNIGGKTGSLSNKKHTVKYDWFTGFGQTKNGKKQIVAAVIVGHRKYIGTRASRYGRLIFKEYFKNYFASNNQISAKKG